MAFLPHWPLSVYIYIAVAVLEFIMYPLAHYASPYVDSHPAYRRAISWWLLSRCLLCVLVSCVGRRSALIPVHVDHLIERHELWVILILGDAIIVLVGIDPGQLNARGYGAIFFCAILVFFLLLAYLRSQVRQKRSKVLGVQRHWSLFGGDLWSRQLVHPGWSSSSCTGSQYPSAFAFPHLVSTATTSHRTGRACPRAECVLGPPIQPLGLWHFCGPDGHWHWF